MSERLIPVADVVTTHGLDGWLKLNPFNPDTTLVSSLEKLYLEKNGIASEHKVESIKPHKGQLLAKLGGVDSIEQAEKWVGSVACVAEANLPTLNSGEYYHYQTIGLEVFDLQGKRIGVITRIWPTAAGGLYVVQGPEKEYLVPAVKEIIEKVDFAAGKMIINPPEGLLDL